MALKEIDLGRLQKMAGAEKADAIEQYKQEKETLIHEYMRLQDLVDEYNEKIYQICCQVEQINIVLNKMDAKP